MVIRSDGWNVPSKGISIDQSVSSQFASALALSAWKLPVPLIVRGHGKVVSESYFAMTQQLLSRAGMEIRYEEPGSFTVPAGSSVRSGQIVAEIDVSSAFAIAAFAALKGKAVFQRWPSDSLQPDAIFTSLLSRMGCRVIVSSGTLEVSSPEDRLVSIEHDLRNAPDLFPVLATLCALAKGKSRLFGAPHLKHKESDRREKTRELIQGLGRACNPIEGGLEIHGRPPEDGIPSKKVRYDTDHDHRLAFAAALAKRAGLNIDILHPEVVSKSFPEFWALTEASA
jgi:3-phosphoshikimate 1-carboxyvinyltransferase